MDVGTRSVAAVIAAALVACAAPAKVASGVTIREEIAPSGHSIIHVEGSSPTVAVTSGALIGDKDGPNLLHNIAALLLSKDNALYVSSSGTKRVMRYDRDGKYASDIGTTGEGPGEYGVPSTIVWLSDTLLVNDPGNGRIVKFTSDGKSFNSTSHARANVPLFGLGDRAFGQVDFDRSTGKLQRVYLVHRANGKTDTLTKIDQSKIHIDPASGGGMDCDAGSTIEIFTTTWRASLLVRPAPDGTLLVATTDRYRLVFLNQSGDTARVVERALLPPPVTDEEWRIESERYDEFRRRLPPLTSCTPSSLTRIRSKPMLNDLFFDSAGNLWVDASTSEGRFFEVFDMNGRLLRRVQSVARLATIAPYVRGELMAVVETDSLDIQQVRLYRIGGAG